jgi:hypothetical protein
MTEHNRHQPDAVFFRCAPAEQQNGACLAGYLLLLTWPTSTKARKKVISEVTENFNDRDLPGMLPAGACILLWTDNKSHRFDANEILKTAQKAKIAQLTVHDTGSSFRFETCVALDDEDKDEELRVLREAIMARLADGLGNESTVH